MGGGGIELLIKVRQGAQLLRVKSHKLWIPIDHLVLLYLLVNYTVVRLYFLIIFLVIFQSSKSFF